MPVNTRQDPLMIAARVMKAFGAIRPFRGANHRMGLKAATVILGLCEYEIAFKQALKKTELFSLSDEALRDYFYMSATSASRLRSQSSSQSRSISSRNSLGVIGKEYAYGGLNTLPKSGNLTVESLVKKYDGWLVTYSDGSFERGVSDEKAEKLKAGLEMITERHYVKKSSTLKT